MYHFDPTTGTLTVKSSLLARVLTFTAAHYPSCCQAYVLHGFSCSDPLRGFLVKRRIPAGYIKKIVLTGAPEIDGVPDGMSAFAITSDGQPLAALALKAAGFGVSHEWLAHTGSTLTAWHYNPGDQDPDHDEDDDGEENY